MGVHVVVVGSLAVVAAAMESEAEETQAHQRICPQTAPSSMTCTREAGAAGVRPQASALMVWTLWVV